MKKRVLSFALTFLLVFSAVPFGTSFTAMAETPSEVVLPLTEREVYYGANDAEKDSQVTYASKYAAMGTFEKALYTAAVNSQDSTDISGLKLSSSNANIAKLTEDIQKYIDKYPELYNIEKYGFSYNPTTGLITKINLYYSYSAAEYKAMNTKYKAAAAKMTTDLKSASTLTDVEKALLLHDRIAAFCEYDYDNYLDETVPIDSYNMYGALVKGVAVCQGYAKSYQWMLNELGIENYLCSSKQLGHVWNIIKVDGEFYHVDITWDDPVYDVDGRVNHDNFLLSSNGIFNTEHALDGQELSDVDYDTTPSSTKYENYFWNKCKTAFQLVDGEIYYLTQKQASIGKTVGVICEREGLLDGNDNELYTVDDVWRTGIFTAYPNNYSRLASDGEELYFSTTDTVYQYDIVNETVHKIYEPDMSDYDYFNIYGFKLSNGYLYCNINDSANFGSYTKNTPDNANPGFGIVVPFGATPTFSLNLAEQTVTPGQVLQLSITGFAANGSGATLNDASWSSSDSAVASVDSVGKVTVHKVGLAYIYCNIQKASANCKIVSILPGNIVFNLANIDVTDIPDCTYTGEAYTPEVALSYNGVELEKGIDYTAQYSKNTNAGTAIVTFTGNNSPYVGKFTKEFKINPLDISDQLTTALDKYTYNRQYTGLAQTVNFAILYGDNTLQTGTDYDVEYKNNINAGTATVTATAKGNFKGSYSKNFTISKVALQYSGISYTKDVAYTGSAIKIYPVVKCNSKTLVNGRDYKLTYSSNYYAGIGTMYVSGIGNYSGSYKYSFTIHPAKVTGLKMTSGSGTYVKLKWTKAKTGTGYIVLRATSYNGTYKAIAVLPSLSKYYYTSKSLSKGKTYYYKVVCYKDISGKRIGSSYSSVLTTKTATKAPTIKYYKNLSSKKAKVKCSKVSGASGYQVYMSTKKSSGYKRIYSGSKYYYTKSKLKKGKTYYFKMRTYRTINGIKVYSSYSSYKKIKIKK